MLVAILEAGALTRIVLVSTPLAASEGQVKTTLVWTSSVWALVMKMLEAVPPSAGVADTRITFPDKLLVTITGWAVTGPRLLTITEYTSTPSEMTGLGELVTQTLRSAVGTDILV